MAGKFQVYSEHKDSGIGWMGAVPNHWNIIPCRSVVKNLVDKNEGAKDQNYLSLMANVGVILYDDKGDVGNKKPDDLSKCKIVKKGNLVINSMNYAIGSYGMSSYDGVCSPVYIVLDTNSELIEQRFALRLFENSTFQKYLATFGNGILEHRAAIGWDDIKGAYIPLPTKLEQKAILNFLDHETAKIDKLIAKQQQLISLLKEKRQAVISHAVTKGLKPNVPMVDSNINWLGKVPEHWCLCSIKYMCTEITDGAHVSPDTEEGEHFFISIADIKKGVINFEDALLTSNSSFQYLIKTGCMPRSGDILFSKDGTIGQTAITPENKEFVVASSLIIIRPNRKKVTSHYLNFLLQSSFVLEQIESFVKGAALRRLSIQNLLKVIGIFPPLHEQEQIAEYLRAKLNRYDELEKKANELIAFQRERRTALISAAVTGKIDVRHWRI